MWASMKFLPFNVLDCIGNLSPHGLEPSMVHILLVVYVSNRPQVSMGYRLINHAGCW